MTSDPKPAAYILALTPDQPNAIKDVFDRKRGQAATVLERPGEFRWAGWDMNTLDQATIVDGAYLEVRNGARKRIQLYEDGTLIARGSIDTDFLGWAASENQPFRTNPRVHALAIIEFTTAFVYLYQRLIPLLLQPPKTISFHVEIKHGQQGDSYLYTMPFRVNTLGWARRDRQYQLTEDNTSYEGDLDANEVLTDPSRAAFTIIARLFLFFGVPTDLVPYTEEREGVRRISVEQIQKTV